LRRNGLEPKNLKKGGGNKWKHEVFLGEVDSHEQGIDERKQTSKFDNADGEKTHGVKIITMHKS